LCQRNGNAELCLGPIWAVPIGNVVILGAFQRDQHIELTRALLPKSDEWLILR
jgi:hypothetical protein